MEVKINGKYHHFDVVVKLDPDKVGKAEAAAASDGADNVFWRVGKETYVGSGRGLDLAKVDLGDPVRFNKHEAEVVFIDTQINTADRGGTLGVEWSTLPSMVVGGKVATVVRGKQEALAAKRAFGPRMTRVATGGSGIVANVLVMVGAAGLAAIGGAVYGAKRTVNLDAMKAYGTVVGEPVHGTIKKQPAPALTGSVTWPPAP